MFIRTAESVGEGIMDLELGDHVLPVFTKECKECFTCFHRGMHRMFSSLTRGEKHMQPS